MTDQRFRYRAPPELYKPNCFNATIQIDFIGPLQTHKGDYACTMACEHSGIMLAKAHNTPVMLWPPYTHYGVGGPDVAPWPLLSLINAYILLVK
jgi:hypothetical protein